MRQAIRKGIEKLGQIPMLLMLRERYLLLSDKDQKALNLLSIALVIFLFYMVIWEPIHRWSDHQQKAYVNQKSTAQWIKNNIDQAREFEKRQHLEAKQDIVSVITGSAQRMQLRFSQVQPSRRGISISFDQVAYQKLQGWLELLSTQYYIEVHQIRIDLLAEKGLVRAFVLFSR
ncbi:hypothetical protein CI610_02449 [invertebrate metagenome]|uniref:General secretion pathway protein M n=1 Tax=invertebrate metagenome TaxID=1711999 RepID=A0A2H9T5X1_9ZZZZ